MKSSSLCLIGKPLIDEVNREKSGKLIYRYMVVNRWFWESKLFCNNETKIFAVNSLFAVC